MTDTDAVLWAVTHAATEAEALALYSKLREHVGLGPITPRLRRFLSDQLWRRQREGPPQRLSRFFWLSLRVSRRVAAIKRTLRRSLFEAGPAQRFDPHRGQSFAGWLRHGEGESRPWERVTRDWLRTGRDDNDW